MLLALDLATTTGWCAGRGDTLPDAGIVRIPSTGQDLGPYFDFFFRWLHAKITELQEAAGIEVEPGTFGPRCVSKEDLIIVFEAPILPESRYDPATRKWIKQTNLTTTRRLQGLAGFVEAIATQRNCLCEEVYLATVKKAIGGSGKADKADMVAAARRCGLPVETHDAADAFGVWIVMVRTYAREYQQVWDQKLYGPRSML